MSFIKINGKRFNGVPDAPGIWVSRCGISYSTRDRGWCKSAKPLKLKMWIDPDGYPTVTTRWKFNRKLRLHEAVLTAWGHPRPSGFVCRHLDGDPSNNNLGNLKWGTYQENIDDRGTHGRTALGERNASAKMTEKFVLKIRWLYKINGLKFLVSKFPKYSKFALWAACTGYTWNHLPNSTIGKRKCSKKGWRDAIKS